MDRDAFDDLTRRLAASPHRRTLIGALFGGGLAVLAEGVGAGKRRRKRRIKKTRKAAAGRCSNPRRSSNLDGCNFDDAKFEGIDLSSSSMRGTLFRGAELCGANLGSSNLENADFRNANLTRTTLRSSGCDGAIYDGATLCGTIMCDGSVRNDGCPAGTDPNDICCGLAGCGPGRVCCGKRCQPGDCCSSADCGATGFCEDGICRSCLVCDKGCPFTSMREALKHVFPGGTVYVCPGRYYGGFTVSNHLRGLTIVGAGSGTGGTIFDGSRDDFPFAHIIVAALDVRLRDFRITGHVSWDIGGGLLTADYADAVLRRVRIDGNHGQYGGGIFNYGFAVLEEGTVITNNSAAFGGGGIFNQGVVSIRAGSQLFGNRPNDCSGPGQGCPRAEVAPENEGE